MSETLERVRACVAARRVHLTRHGSKALDDDGLSLDDVLDSTSQAVLVEDYSEAKRGPSLLALHTMRDGSAVHVVWGFHAETDDPAVLVTAYRPDARLWSPDFTRRTP